MGKSFKENRDKYKNVKNKKNKKHTNPYKELYIEDVDWDGKYTSKYKQ